MPSAAETNLSASAPPATGSRNSAPCGGRTVLGLWRSTERSVSTTPAHPAASATRGPGFRRCPGPAPRPAPSPDVERPGLLQNRVGLHRILWRRPRRPTAGQHPRRASARQHVSWTSTSALGGLAPPAGPGRRARRTPSGPRRRRPGPRRGAPDRRPGTCRSPDAPAAPREAPQVDPVPGWTAQAGPGTGRRTIVRFGDRVIRFSSRRRAQRRQRRGHLTRAANVGSHARRHQRKRLAVDVDLGQRRPLMNRL